MVAKAKKITGPTERGRVGREGEALAADFLENKGFRIVARNWSCRFGEIDLIVARAEELRFIEVKTRTGTTFGYPEEAVSRAKRQKWFRTMEFWLQLHAPKTTCYQADVISILLKTALPEIVWIENIDVG